MKNYICPHCNFIFDEKKFNENIFIITCHCFRKNKFFSSYSPSNNVLFISIGYHQDDLAILNLSNQISSLILNNSRKDFNYILSPEQIIEYFNLNWFL